MRTIPWVPVYPADTALTPRWRASADLARDPTSKDERKAFRTAHYFVVRWIHLASSDERGVRRGDAAGSLAALSHSRQRPQRLVEVLQGAHGLRSPHLPTRIISLRTFAALDVSHGLALSRDVLVELTPQLVAVRDPEQVCRRTTAAVRICGRA